MAISWTSWSHGQYYFFFSPFILLIVIPAHLYVILLCFSLISLSQPLVLQCGLYDLSTQVVGLYTAVYSCPSIHSICQQLGINGKCFNFSPDISGKLGAYCGHRCQWSFFGGVFFFVSLDPANIFLYWFLLKSKFLNSIAFRGFGHFSWPFLAGILPYLLSYQVQLPVFLLPYLRSLNQISAIYTYIYSIYM